MAITKLHFDQAEPAAEFWRDISTYDEVLDSRYLRPLEEQARETGNVPSKVQREILASLHWYFTVDARERAPTVALTEGMAEAFHSRIERIITHIDSESISSFDSLGAGPEARHALFSYKRMATHSAATLGAYDHERRLVRISYYVHGEPPVERILLDGKVEVPAFAKYRGCRFFHRLLFRQRIVWLAAKPASRLELHLDATQVDVCIGPGRLFYLPHELRRPVNPRSVSALKDLVATVETGRKPLPWNKAGVKARLLRALARLTPVRRLYKDAWVFVDRDVDADDNAEHLYRWVRQHRPDINAWYLLQPSAADWSRLAREGFRLLRPGLRRKLLLLNSRVLASSHVFAEGGFNKARYGDLMRWNFVHLRHGIQQNDQSHWLNNQAIDRLIASSPDEFLAIVRDDSPYVLTRKEVVLVGMPRHDALLLRAQRAAHRNLIVIFPTWRAGLVDGRRLSGLQGGGQAESFAASEYARRWSSVLGSTRLKALALQHNQRIVFVPHENARPYLNAFSCPEHVWVWERDHCVIQEILGRAVAFVTDYTSAAFDMAYLRTQVFYYQFDRERFYSGDHNWRPGHFEYQRDGFGPLSVAEPELLGHLERFYQEGQDIKSEWRRRMEKAFPEQRSDNCERVFTSILELQRPFSESTG